jgi:hypothetical protein
MRAALRLERSDDRDSASAAIEDLDIALGLEGGVPSTDRALWVGLRGEAHLLRSETAAAISDLTRAIDEGRPEPRFYASRARAHRAQGELDAALKDAESAVEAEKRRNGPRVAEYEKLRRELDKK